jgi:carbon monoxide dehydrogenase subunit G
MKVKVGPITGTYRGTLRFLEQDEDARRAVMSARAAEVNGQGDAEARITTQIEPAEGDASRIRMETDLQMRGRVAQFGRGAMEKISQRMFEEFARNLEREMSAGGGAGAAQPDDADGQAGGGDVEAQGAGETAEGGGAAGREQPAGGAGGRAAAAPAQPSRGEAGGEALDAMSLFVTPALKKALPILGPALVGMGYGYLLGRLRELRR